MSGGNPRTLTLREFLDVAFAILVEEYQRLGIDLLSAIEKVEALGMPVDEQPPPERVAEQNQQSMQQLMAMMSGVKGAPV